MSNENNEPIFSVLDGKDPCLSYNQYYTVGCGPFWEQYYPDLQACIEGEAPFTNDPGYACCTCQQ